MKKIWKKATGSFMALIMALTVFCGFSFANDGMPVLLFDQESYQTPQDSTLHVTLKATQPDNNDPYPNLGVSFLMTGNDGTEEDLGTFVSDAKGKIEFNVAIGNNFPYIIKATSTEGVSEREVTVNKGEAPVPPEPVPEKQAAYLSFNLDSYSTTETLCELNGILSADKGGSQGITGADITWTATDAAGNVQNGTVATDEIGGFLFGINTEAGQTYSISANFAGNDQYNSVSAATVAANTATIEKGKLTLEFDETSLEAEPNSAFAANLYALDASGNPVKGVSVTFTVTGADGSIVDLGGAQTAVTNDEGLAICNVNLAEAFPYSIQAVSQENDTLAAAQAQAMITQPEKNSSMTWIIILICAVIALIIVIIIIIAVNKKKRREAMNGRDRDRE